MVGQKNTGAEKIGGREKDGSRKKTEQEKTKKCSKIDPKMRQIYLY